MKPKPQCNRNNCNWQGNTGPQVTVSHSYIIWQWRSTAWQRKLYIIGCVVRNHEDPYVVACTPYTSLVISGAPPCICLTSFLIDPQPMMVCNSLWCNMLVFCENMVVKEILRILAQASCQSANISHVHDTEVWEYTATLWVEGPHPHITQLYTLLACEICQWQRNNSSRWCMWKTKGSWLLWSLKHVCGSHVWQLILWSVFFQSINVHTGLHWHHLLNWNR